MAVYDIPLTVICIGMSLLNVVVLKFFAARRQESEPQPLGLERGKLPRQHGQRRANDRNNKGERP